MIVTLVFKKIGGKMVKITKTPIWLINFSNKSRTQSCTVITFDAGCDLYVILIMAK
jgi:hypothetical protein